MSAPGFQIRQCEQPNCDLRYPIVDEHHFGLTCPCCGSNTRLVLTKQLSDEPGNSTSLSSEPVIEALLDNVRSAWNVGSMFRTAEGLGVRHLYLCGITPTPENVKVLKTSLGAEKTVTWSQHNDGVQIAFQLNQQGLRLWALEGDNRSELLYDAVNDKTGSNIVLVVGNEISGVDPDILELCDRILHIPMMGIKRSFNVAVAFGIAAHFLRSSALANST